MRLLVLGATGRTGLRLTEQAIARGHDVTALVRAPEKVTLRAPRLQLVGGALDDADALARHLAGKDALLSALGQRGAGPPTFLRDSAATAVTAMRRAGVRRLIVVSSALLWPDIGTLGELLRVFFRAVLADSREMERTLADSDRDWTVLRPPRLVDHGARGRYRIVEHAPLARSIARDDLARCILDLAERGAFAKKVVSVSK